MPNIPFDGIAFLLLFCLAIDISPGMLAIAKQRAVDNGSQDIIEYWETAAQDLVLPDLSIDAALCRWGLMFLPNLNSTLLKVHRSLVSVGDLLQQFGPVHTRSQLSVLQCKLLASQYRWLLRLRLVPQIHIVLRTQIDLQIIYLEQDLEMLGSRQ